MVTEMAHKLSTKKHHVQTDKTKKSLVKVVVLQDEGKWISPSKGQIFHLTSAPKLPDISFQIDTSDPPPYHWKWSIQWPANVSGLKESAHRGHSLKTFKESGSFDSNEKSWKVDFEGKILGGTLTVEVTSSCSAFKRSIYIKGENPSKDDAEAYIKTIPDTEGFAKLLEQETHFKQFINADGYPVVAFDGGYGITQLTNPAPTYEQAWNWKENTLAGSKLYQQKQKIAKAYLSQKGRTYSDEQLRLETWSRWNGGSYHIWDEKTKAWIRNPNVMCDPATGNIGWDMTNDTNKGKTLKELHDRDADTYKHPKDKGSDHPWKYCGECYADHVSSN